MHDMLLTLDALQPTHELDTLMGNIGSAAGFDSSRIQTAAAAVYEAHTGVNPVAATPGFAALPSDQQAEITTFVRLIGEAHETSALTHAAKYQSAGTGGVDVLQQMTLVSHALTAGSATAARLGSADGLEFLRIVVDRRLVRLRTSADPQEARRWAGQVAAQLDIVTRCANGLTFAAELLDSAESSAPGQVPSYIKVPMQVVGQNYAEALRQSDLVDVGYDKLAHADGLAKSLQLDILEGTAADARRLLSEAAKNSASGTDDFGTAQRDFAAEIKQARDLIDADPAKYAEALKTLQGKIATFHQRAVVISTRAQFEATLNSINALSGKAQDTAHPDEAKALWALIRRIGPYYGHWTALERAYTTEDQAAQKAGWAVVRGEADALAKLLKEVDAKVASVAHTIAVDEMIFRVAIFVLIGLATGGFGDLLLGVAGGLELGEFATFALVTSGEALFFTGATTLIFEKDPTVGKFLSELVVNLVTFGAMRGVSAMYKGILGPAAKTLPGTAGEVVVMLTAQTATSLAMADHAKRAATGRGLSDDEAHDIVLESVLVGVATMVGARVTHDLLPDFRARGTKLGQKLARINLGRAALRSTSAKVINASTTAKTGAGQPGTTAPVLKAATAADVERVQTAAGRRRRPAQGRAVDADRDQGGLVGRSRVQGGARGRRRTHRDPRRHRQERGREDRHRAGAGGAGRGAVPAGPLRRGRGLPPEEPGADGHRGGRRQRRADAAPDPQGPQPGQALPHHRTAQLRLEQDPDAAADRSAPAGRAAGRVEVQGLHRPAGPRRHVPEPDARGRLPALHRQEGQGGKPREGPRGVGTQPDHGRLPTAPRGRPRPGLLQAGRHDRAAGQGTTPLVRAGPLPRGLLAAAALRARRARQGRSRPEGRHPRRAHLRRAPSTGPREWWPRCWRAPRRPTRS